MILCDQNTWTQHKIGVLDFALGFVMGSIETLFFRQ